MKTEDFIARHAKPIAALYKSVPQHYCVTGQEFAERLAGIAVRSGEADGNAKTFLASVKAEELCMALACEKGDSAAWEKFEGEYRHSMQAAAR
ncbi:MAG: hypothetical protein ABIU20_03320, partial [Blastocatellia bacterium]